jgi:hypothetical protein
MPPGRSEGDRRFVRGLLDKPLRNYTRGNRGGTLTTSTTCDDRPYDSMIQRIGNGSVAAHVQPQLPARPVGGPWPSTRSRHRRTLLTSNRSPSKKISFTCFVPLSLARFSQSRTSIQ